MEITQEVEALLGPLHQKRLVEPLRFPFHALAVLRNKWLKRRGGLLRPACEERALAVDIGRVRMGFPHLLEGAHQPLFAGMEKPEIIGKMGALLSPETQSLG